MRSMFNRFMVFFIIVSLFAAPLASSAFAQGPAMDIEKQIATEEMVFDACIVRPVGIVGTLLGCGAFIISLPFSLLGGNTKEAFNTLVTQPAKHTFVRPLGSF